MNGSMIREAEAQDREALFRLYRMLVPNSKKMNVQAEQLERLRDDPANYVWVYEEDGELLGSVTLNVCQQALHGTRPYGIVENVVVHADHRGRNIGHKLFDHIEKYCRSLDCHRIMLLSSSERPDAHRFFEREGYSGTVSRGFKKYL